MKKIYRYFFAAIAIASAAACAEQMDNDQVPGGQAGPADFAQMTISASLGEVTKTTYKDQSVLWEGTESITVFSKGSEDSPTEFAMNWCSEDNTKASFTGLADLNAESYYAVYPNSATNACTSEGVLTVEIPARQTAVADGFASGANVSVAAWQNAEMSSENDIIFNNVCSLLSFGFETDADAILTKSVTVKMKNETGYINIAGNVSVSYNPEGDLVVSEGTTDNIVLTAPTGGFAKGVTYYVLVAPVGQIAEMELIYTHTDGTTTCTRKNSNIIAFLSRSTLVPLDIIPVAYDNLPQEDFQVTVDFTQGWPFPNDPCVNASGQQVLSDAGGGETYRFYYTPEGTNVQLLMNFVIKRTHGSGDAYAYSYDDEQHYLLFSQSAKGSTFGIINVPGVEGRYISSIEIIHSVSAKFTIADGKQVWYNVSPNASSSTTAGPTVFELPFGDVPTYWEGAYNIRMRTANTGVQKLIITYSKNNPAE